MIQAIETRYKGYRFRSRLEARYAVFFDALGIGWDYEPEGFQLGSAGWYLPDFRLRASGFEPMFVEVKPKHQQNDGHWLKARVLAASGYNVLLLGGEPNVRCDTLCLGNPIDENKHYKDISIWTSTGPEVHVQFVRGGLVLRPFTNIPTDPPDTTDFLNAVRAARSARFEHGESGAA